MGTEKARLDLPNGWQNHTSRGRRSRRTGAYTTVDQTVFAEPRAENPQETVRQDTALQICLDLVDDEARQFRAAAAIMRRDVPEKAPPVSLQRSIKHRLLGSVPLVVEPVTIDPIRG